MMPRFSRRSALVLGGAALLAGCVRPSPPSETPVEPVPTGNGEDEMSQPRLRRETEIFDPDTGLQVADGEVGAVTTREIAFWDTDGTQLRRVHLEGAGDFVRVWALAGGLVAYRPDRMSGEHEDTSLLLADATSGEVMAELPGGPTNFVALNSEHLAAAGPDGVRVFSLGTELVEVGHIDAADPAPVSYLPDGRLVVAGPDTARVWSADGSEVLWEGEVGRRYGQFAVADPRCVFTVFGESASAVQVRDLESFELIAEHPMEFWVGKTALSPDGSVLAMLRNMGTSAGKMLLTLLDLSSGELREFGGDAELHSVAWSEDGLFTLSTEKGVLRWDVETGESRAFGLE